MGILDNFFKKKEPLLSEEDIKELRAIERKSYMEEAKKIVSNIGKEQAKKFYGVKEPKPVKPKLPDDERIF